jgi:hypothetical protein
VFEASAVNQQLSLSIDRATYLAANELMMPPDGIPLADSLMRSSGLARSDKGSWYTFVGCVLEKQLAVLEVSKWKPRVQAALPALLDKIADAYKSAARPVRAARCMVKHIALSYSISLGDGKPPLGALEELARLSEMKVWSNPDKVCWYLLTNVLGLGRRRFAIAFDSSLPSHRPLVDGLACA